MNYLEAFFILSVLLAGATSAFVKRLPRGGRPLSPWTIGMALGGLAWLALLASGRLSWRIVPAFAAFMGLFALGLADGIRRRKDLRDRDREGDKAFASEETRFSKIARRTLGGFGVAMALVSLAAALVFPVRDLPAPSGPHRVGTAVFEVADETRTGVYLDAAGTPRRVMAQAWYPAEAGKAFSSLPRAPWLADPALAKAYADYVGLPHWMMSQLRLILANGRIGAPAAAGTGPMPVVIISHGWTGSRAMHTDLAEELASRGLVAIAIDHSYGALSVSFPDGAVAPLYRGALPDRGTTEKFGEHASALVATYAADIAAVARRVRSGATVPQLAGRLDAERIALAGHSTGGGAAVLAAMDDPAFLGVAGLDAWVEPLGDLRLDEGLAAPQLHVGSAAWKGGINSGFLSKLKKASGPWAAYRIPGSGHADFAMVRHVTSVGAWLGLAGKGDGFAFARKVAPLVCDWLELLLSRDAEAAFGALPELDRE